MTTKIHTAYMEYDFDSIASIAGVVTITLFPTTTISDKEVLDLKPTNPHVHKSSYFSKRGLIIEFLQFHVTQQDDLIKQAYDTLQ
jgi:hypothetical protein